MTRREWVACLFLSAVALACVVAALITNGTARVRRVAVAVVPVEDSTPRWHRRVELVLGDSLRIVKEWRGDSEPRLRAPK